MDKAQKEIIRTLKEWEDEARTLRANYAGLDSRYKSFVEHHEAEVKDFKSANKKLKRAANRRIACQERDDLNDTILDLKEEI